MKKPVKKLADAIAKTKGRPPRKTTKRVLDGQERPWEPEARDLAWYHEWSVNHLGFAEIGRRCNPPVDRATVWHSVKRTGDWFRTHMIEDIVAQRYRQTETLESIASRALAAWEESRGKHQVKTTKESKPQGDGKGIVEEVTTREEILGGETACLSVAMQALADIRKIWGLEVPKQVAVHVNDESGLLRVDGLDRKEARRRQAEALLAKAGIVVGEVSQESKS